MKLKPEFCEAAEKQLVALSGEFTLETRHQIPALWEDFWLRNWPLDGDEEQAAYGVSYSMQPDGAFSYAVGRHVSPVPASLPEGACLVTLSAGRYAVFHNHGPVAEIPVLFDAIFSAWLPRSGETQRAGAAVFERYPYEEGASPEAMTYEIWVPVEAN